MEKTQYRLLRLPESVFDNICQRLGPIDLKSLSLTSHGLMSAIENVQKWSPRLHLVTTGSTFQHKKASRVIPEAYPGFYLNQIHKQLDQGQQEIIALVCLPASPPTYNEAQSATWSSAMRFQKQSDTDTWKRRVWICPHVDCKFDDIKRITQQQEPPVSMYDTVRMLCPLPKCSLWARHAVLTTSTTPATYEMCSVVRIYRRRCTSLDGVNRMLKSRAVYRHLVRALARLELPICSHLDISSPEVTTSYKLDRVLLLDAGQRYVDVDMEPNLRQVLDEHCCRKCSVTGTYTTWGFLARYTQDLDAFWVDIEMMLCRPLFDCDVQDGYESVHWMSHARSGFDRIVYGMRWEAWAKIVAETGFDWRMPLPAAFLRQYHRGLLDFPTKT